MTSFQVMYVLIFLVRRVGRLGGHLSLDLFDPSRGEPLVRFSIRLAVGVAWFGVSQAIGEREVADTSIGPLDFSLWTRWALYLALPPLSWVAAAIVEEAVQGSLGR